MKDEIASTLYRMALAICRYDGSISPRDALTNYGLSDAAIADMYEVLLRLTEVQR